MMRQPETLRISGGKGLFDDWIESDLGRFQRDNRDDPSRPVLLEFGDCAWFSPLPLLAIATELAVHSAKDRSVRLDLGSGGTGGLAEAKSRARKFFALHGFLGLFRALENSHVAIQFDRYATRGEAGCWHDSDETIAQLIALLSSWPEPLRYGSAKAFPATLWKLPDRKDGDPSTAVRNYVGKLLRSADSAWFRGRSATWDFRGTTLQRLNQVLLELVDNASEHAYRDQGVPAFVGLYCRAIERGDAMSDEARAREGARSPALSSIASGPRDPIEIFVVDVGRGILQDFVDGKWSWLPDGKGDVAKSRIDEDAGASSAYSQKVQPPRYPLREMAARIFVEPLSRHDRTKADVLARRGASTGLMHLNAVLGRNRDASALYFAEESVAGRHPRARGEHAEQVSRAGGRKLRNGFYGTLFHIGISQQGIPPFERPWFVPEAEESREILQALVGQLATRRSKGLSPLIVVDVDARHGLSDVEQEVRRVMRRRGDGVIVRTGKVAEKSLILRVVDAWVATAQSFASGPQSTLCFADLGRYQAEDIIWMLRTYLRRIERHPRVPLSLSVILATEDLCCVELPLDLHDAPRGSFQLRFSTSRPIGERLVGQLLALLQQLRHADSAKLWARIDQLDASAAHPVLLRDVNWLDDDIIPIFINFAMLIQDKLSARYVRRALRRLLALFPRAKEKALDMLVEASLHDARKWLRRDLESGDELVLIGSLSLTGSTLDRFREPHGSTIAAIIDCIESPYYPRPGDRAPRLSALTWLKPVSLTKGVARYRRHGKTSHIEPVATGSWNATPYFDQELYRAVEGEGMIKLGHWTYGDRHSLLDINLALAIEQSVESSSGIIPALEQHILRWSLKSVVLTFPLHPLAYRLAHEVSARVAARGVEVVLLPILFLPRLANGMARFSPLVAERAAQLANTVTTAVLVDIGFITGRTLRHSSRQLRAAGFRAVHAVCIVNRSSAPMHGFEDGARPPLDTIASDGSEVRVPVPVGVWRWNVPTLGSGSHCALCAALHSVARLAQLLREPHPELLPHVERIGQQWAARSAADSFGEAGLPPLALPDDLVAMLAAELPPLFVAEQSPSWSSAMLCSRVVEWIRVSAEVDVGLEVSRLLPDSYTDHAIELLVVVLLLSGGLSDSDVQHYVLELVRRLLHCSEQGGDSSRLLRRANLVGIATLVLAMQNEGVKLAVIEEVWGWLAMARVESPDVRIALFALTMDSDESGRLRRTLSTLFDHSAPRHGAGFLVMPNDDTSSADTWSTLVKVFGRSKTHGDVCTLGKLRGRESWDYSRRNLLHGLDELARLLGSCNPRFVEACLAVPLGRILFEGIYEARLKVVSGAIDPQQLADLVDVLVEPLERAVHGALVRYGRGAEEQLFDQPFLDYIDQAASAKRMVLYKDVAICGGGQRWPDNIQDYFVVCDPLLALLLDIFNNVANATAALGDGGNTAQPPDFIRTLPEPTPKHPVRLWIAFELCSGSREMEILFCNRFDGRFAKYLPAIPYINELQIACRSEHVQRGDDHYFVVRLRLPSLSKLIGAGHESSS